MEELLGQLGRGQSWTAVHLQSQGQHPLEDGHHSAGDKKKFVTIYSIHMNISRATFLLFPVDNQKHVFCVIHLICSSLSLLSPCSVDFIMAEKSHLMTSLHTNTQERQQYHLTNENQK